jgi:hypothetical protein
MFNLMEAQGICSLGEGRMRLEAAAGYFPFKYNDNAMHLGEYLLRSGAYPPYVITSFKFPMIRLWGLRVSGWLFENLRQDLLLTSEYTTPDGDYSLSYLVGHSLRNILDYGAGISFQRLIEVGKIRQMLSRTAATDSRDSVIIEGGDTLFYTMSGVKLMLRCAFDPKKLIPLQKFGERDLRLYAEAAILGARNYGEWSSTPAYDNMWERMPVMIGFNIPAFNVLDVLSFEFEWYGSMTVNDPGVNWNPDPKTDELAELKDDLKWSLFLEKSIQQFTVSALVASDHYRAIIDGGFTGYQERIRQTNEWHYKVRLTYGF